MSPNEALAALQAYWTKIDEFNASWNDVIASLNAGDIYAAKPLNDALALAIAAMTDLMATSATNETVRKAFATNNVFTTELAREHAWGSGFEPASSGVDGLAAHLPRPGFHPLDPLGRKPPRLIMLEGIKGAATGGFFSTQDPSGLTTWIGSVELAASVIGETLAADNNGDVQLALLGLLKNAGIPYVWAHSFLAQGGPLDALERRIAQVQWSPDASAQVSYTRQLVKGVADVRGRLGTFAIGDWASKLPTFATGTENGVATIPGSSKPWYMQGATVVGVLAGVGIGAYTVERRSR